MTTDQPTVADPMAAVVRRLQAERQAPEPAPFHNPTRDLVAELEQLRRPPEQNPRRRRGLVSS